MKPWRWKETSFELGSMLKPVEWKLVDGQGRHRASIWKNSGEFVWHTFDTNGTGGENDGAPTLDDAKRHVIASIVIQGWAPCGWTVVKERAVTSNGPGELARSCKP